VRTRFQRLRPWLTLAGVVLAVGVVLPPGETQARRYVLAQAVQFAVLAVAAPALIVLGAPWQLLRGVLVDRIAIARSHRPGTARAWGCLVGFIAVAAAWRLPIAVNALARHPILVLAQAISLIAAGCALWLELVESPPLLPRVSRPLRAAFATLPMWTIWAIAYIMAFSHATWFAAYAHHGHGLGTVADQEIAAGLLWAIPGLCFGPVVFVSLISWLRDSSDPDAELREASDARDKREPGAPRPPRGWRLPSA